MFPGTMAGIRQYVGTLDVALLRDIGLLVPGSVAIDKICATTGCPHGLPSTILGPTGSWARGCTLLVRICAKPVIDGLAWRPQEIDAPKGPVEEPL